VENEKVPKTEKLGDVIPDIDPELRDVPVERVVIGSKAIIAFTLLVLVALSLVWLTVQKTLREPTLVDASEQMAINEGSHKLPSKKSEVAQVTPVVLKSDSVLEYVVEEGDWLSTICPNDWQNVATKNDIKNPDLIYPGQRLELTDACGEQISTPVHFASRAEVNRVVPVFRSNQGIASQGEYTEWKYRGTDPLGCDVSPEEALKRFPQLTEADRKELLRKINANEEVARDLEKGEVIGDMLGKKKVYPNTRVAFTPGDGDMVVVYRHERREVIDGVPMRIIMTLSMPVMCCNYALLVERKAEGPPPVPIEAKVIPPPDPPTCNTGPCVPMRLPQDCATTGCVSGAPLSDASPSCDASCAPTQPNSGSPSYERRTLACDGLCPVDERMRNLTPKATFTVLGGAMVTASSPEDICRQTPDVEYKGMALVCLPDGTVRKGEQSPSLDLF
jgi:hypothetical protein